MDWSLIWPNFFVIGYTGKRGPLASHSCLDLSQSYVTSIQHCTFKLTFDITDSAQLPINQHRDDLQPIQL